MPLEKKRVINIETGTSQRNVQTLKQQIKELRDAMGSMEKGTEEWEKASVKLSSALQKQREIAEAGSFTNQDYGNKLANISKVGAGVTAGINGLTNALSLMGIQMGKDDTAMIKFTTSMMAIVQGLSSLDTANKAWKGLLVGINAALDARLKDTASTAANTVSVKANTAAKTENTAATTAGAAATEVATKANNGLSAAFTKMATAMGISKAALGGITAAIGVLVAAIGVLIHQWQKAREEEKALNDQMWKNAEEMAKIKTEIDMLHFDFDRLASSFRTAKEEGQDLTEWVKDHRSELDKLGISTNDLNKIEDVFVKHTDEYKKALADRYKAEAQMIALREQMVERYRILNSIDNYQTDSKGNRFYMLNGQRIELGNGSSNTKLDYERTQQLNAINKLGNQMTDLATTVSTANSTIKKLGAKEDEKPSGTKQQPLTVEVINSAELIKDSRSLLTTLASTLNNFILNKDETVNIKTFIDSMRILLADNVEIKKYLGEDLVDFIENGYSLNIKDETNELLKETFRQLSEGNFDSGVVKNRLASMYNVFWEESLDAVDYNNAGKGILQRGEVFNFERISDLTRELNDLVVQIEMFDYANEENAEDIKKHNANIAENNRRLNQELEAAKKERERNEKEINNKYNSEIEAKEVQIERLLSERVKTEELINKLNLNKKSTGFLGSKSEYNIKIRTEENRLKNINEDINRITKEIDELRDKVNNENIELNADVLSLEKEIEENNKKYLSENMSTPEYKEYIDTLRARVDELKKIIPVIQNITTVYNELENSTIEKQTKVADILKNNYIDRMEMEGASREEIIAATIAFNKAEKEALDKYIKDGNIDIEKKIQLQQRSNALAKENLELEKEAQNIAWKNGKAELEIIQQRIALQRDEREHYQNMYNYSLERLGSADWNDNLYRLEIEQKYYDERFRIAEEFRKLNKISEEDYQQELLDYQMNTIRMALEMEEARARRMLDILDTSISAVGMTVNSVNGLIGEALAREEQDSTRYKQLRIAQTIASGSVASIEALRSGIQSPIPAPGNYALGIALMGATIAQTAMAVGNIRTDTLNGNSSSSLTSGAGNIGGNVYETLAYETNSEISSNIRDSRVYVVESDINQTGNRVYVAESEATW